MGRYLQFRPHWVAISRNCRRAAADAAALGADVIVWKADLRPVLGDRSVEGRRRLRHEVRDVVLASCMRLQPEDIHISTRCPHCGDPHHGKPHLAHASGGPEFSTSSAENVLLIAVGTTSLGVDVAEVERLSSIDMGGADSVTSGALSGLAPRLPSGADPRLAWTVFEALAKGLGKGLAVTPADMAEGTSGWWTGLFRPTPATVACLASMVHEPIVVEAQLWLTGERCTVRRLELLDRSIVPALGPA